MGRSFLPFDRQLKIKKITRKCCVSGFAEFEFYLELCCYSLVYGALEDITDREGQAVERIDRFCHLIAN